jgi:hypothetical protein
VIFVMDSGKLGLYGLQFGLLSMFPYFMSQIYSFIYIFYTLIINPSFYFSGSYLLNIH